MKKNIIIAVAAISSLICVVGFKDNTNWQYKVIPVYKSEASYIEKAINKYSLNGWQFDSTMVIPDDNQDGLSCNLIFKKQK